MIRFRVAGVTFRDDYPDCVHSLAEILDKRPDVAVRFVAEPDNKFDPNAVRIEVLGRQYGYVPKDMAPDLFRAVQAKPGYEALATVVVDPAHPEKPGIEIICDLKLADKPSNPLSDALAAMKKGTS